MKKLKIVCFILFITIVILNVCSVVSFAASYGTIENPIIDPGDWEPTPSTDDSLSEKIGGLLGIIQVIGILASVIVLMIMGIKYMVGSAEEKAINKKAMIPYLVGAVMIFSVTTIPNFVFKATDSLLDDNKYGWDPDIWNNYECSVDGHTFNIYTDGKCDHYDKCGYVCKHTSWKDLGEYSQCEYCNYTCIHTEYEKVDLNYHKCKKCSKQVKHTYQMEYEEAKISYCIKCPSECEHEGGWSDGKCMTCGAGQKNHSHEIFVDQGDGSRKCEKCGFVCKHESWYTDDYKCYVCGKSCEHEKFESNTGKCKKCSYECTHSGDIVDSICEQCKLTVIYLADAVQIGDYVDIDIDYENVASLPLTIKLDLKGWRVLSTSGSGSTGTVKLVSAGTPLTFRNGNEIFSNGMDLISDLSTLNRDILLGNGVDYQGFVLNGFASQNLASIWASNDRIDTSVGVHSLTVDEVQTAYKEITGVDWDGKADAILEASFKTEVMTDVANNAGNVMNSKSYNLLDCGIDYYLGDYKDDSLNLLYVDKDGRISYDGFAIHGIRPVVTLKAGTLITGNEGENGDSKDLAYTLRMNM